MAPIWLAFLDTAMIPPSDSPDQFPPPLSIFAWGLPTPDGLIEEFVADLQDQPVDSLVRLSPVGLSGEGSGGGVIYHQSFHRVAVFMHLDYYDCGFPVEDHLDIWNPLETVLSHWIDLIQLGKVEWRLYSEAQVTTCVSAWDRLCWAIKARISQLPNPPSLISPISGIDADNPEPLVASTVLDAASVPDPSFARSFLTRARRPRFHYIAPGLLLPPADSSGFVAAQPFAVLPRSQHTAPLVCLFPAEGGDQRPIQLTRTTTPFLLLDYYLMSTDTLTPSRVSAGLYTAAVERNGLDTAEDGFRLLLPFTLNDGWGRSVGARRSDGELADRGSFADLFQHGFKPFGGDYYRPQRLERLLDCWRKLVEEGVWSVGPKGVEGTIDTFKDAKLDRWEDYYIPPTW
ncbi:hypothetical protein VF21_10380 [Pseudogymnoascus sp. 05NY08]|nr:hypothetical protein VF21_10380 [Pseudogymnoascus sp. 05NY08]